MVGHAQVEVPPRHGFGRDPQHEVPSANEAGGSGIAKILKGYPKKKTKGLQGAQLQMNMPAAWEARQEAMSNGVDTMWQSKGPFGKRKWHCGSKLHLVRSIRERIGSS